MIELSEYQQLFEENQNYKTTILVKCLRVLLYIRLDAK